MKDDDDDDDDVLIINDVDDDCACLARIKLIFIQIFNS